MNNLLNSSGQVFIGRITELNQIERCIKEVLQGEPRICLIQGEAGIGKTRFLKEVESGAVARGLRVYKGRCIEDLSLPYLPFMETLFPCLEQGFDPPETLYEDDLAMIRHLRRGRLVSSSSTPEQAAQNKSQLFLAVSRAMINLAQRSPMLFIMDDLHWADPCSLDLFAYLAFSLADQTATPLLVIGTHRPVEMEHALARRMRRFEREPIYHSFILPGLDEIESREFLKSQGLSHPSHQFVSYIQGITQGNLLFIHTIVNHLIQQESLQECGRFLVANRKSMATIQLPQDIQAAFSMHVKDLSQTCRNLLATAAVLGEKFSLEHLKAVSGLGVEEILDALEEGLYRNLLIEKEGFQFAQTLTWQAFYQQLSTVRRKRIHLKIAQALEQIDTSDSDKHLLEIAYHLFEAGELAETSHLVTYTHKAGDHAFSIFSWSDAAQCYEAAISAAYGSNISTKEIADLHYYAGLSHYRNTDSGPALDHYERAIALYRSIESIHGLTQALIQQAITTFTLSRSSLEALTNLQPLQEILETLGDDEPQLRGHIATVMSQSYRASRQPEVARQLAKNALEIGKSIQDDHLCANAYINLGLAHLSSLDIQKAHDSLQTALVHTYLTRDVLLQSLPSVHLPLSLTLLGRLNEAEEVAFQCVDLTTKTQNRGAYSIALSHLARIIHKNSSFLA